MKRILLVLAILALAAVGAFAQLTVPQNIDIDIGQVLAIGINPAGLITLGTVAGVPGAQVGGSTHNTSYLRYTVAAAAAARITAQVTAGAVPAGTELHVTSGLPAGSGGGDMGDSAGVVILDATAQDVVTGIGNCWTGTAGGDGANLTYDLVITGSPAFGTTSLTVTYTITTP